MINITGVLTDPMGKPVACGCIRFTSLSNSGEAITGSEAVHKTDYNGVYSFELKEGNYLLEIKYDDEYHEIGNVVVDEFSPSPMNLEDLINYGTPVIPPISDELPTDWENLFEDIIANDEWERKVEHQVRSGDVYSNEQKSIHKAGEQYLALENFTQNSADANHHNQYLSFHDDINNFSAARVQEIFTPKLNGVSQVELFESSNGDEHLREQLSLSGSTGSMLISNELFNIRFYSQDSASLGGTEKRDTVEFKQTYLDDLGIAHIADMGARNNSLKTGEGFHEGEIYSVEEIKYDEDGDITSGYYGQGINLKYTKGGELIEGFEKTSADNVNGIQKVEQLNKKTIQGLDGIKLVEMDTDANEVKIFGKLIVDNPEDFRGDDGSTLDWEFAYSLDRGVTDLWHDAYNEEHGDTWRRDTQYRVFPDGSKEATGEVVYVKLTAEDGLDGDTYFLQTQYTTDEDIIRDVWRDAYAVGDDWRRQREVINETEIKPWWEPERIKGDDGQDGWIPEFEVYYGADGTAPFDPLDPNLADWHKNLSNEDLYKYERTVWWHTYEAFQQTRNASFGIDWSKAVEGTYTPTPWLGATKIKPEAGEDYGDKTAPIFLYLRQATDPTDLGVGVWRYNFDTQEATNVSGNTGGWTQQLPPAGDTPLWVASGTAFSKTNTDENIDNWDVDMMSKNGVKYATAKMYQILSVNASAPSLPNKILNFDFNSQKIISIPDNNWLALLPSNIEEGAKVWMTVAPVTASAEVTVEPVAINDWEEAAVISANSYSALKSVVFKRTNSDISNNPPTGGSYFNPVPNGWSDGVPQGDEILWSSTRVFSSTGGYPQEASWTSPSSMTDTAVPFYEYSVSGTGDPTSNPNEWHITPDDADIYMAQRERLNGEYTSWRITKIKGESGDDAVMSFKSTAFKRQTSKPTSISGGSWANPIPTGWSDGIPSGSLQLWSTTRIFTEDGESPQQSSWTAAESMTDTAVVDYEYSVSGTGNPDTNPSAWHNDATNADVYTAIAITTNGVKGAWKITKIKGETGDDGILTFKSVSFRRVTSTSQITTPVGGSFASPIPTTAGWEDGIPDGDATLWQSTRIFTEDGSAPQQSVWSTPRRTTDVTYFESMYSSAAIGGSAPADPSANSSIWYETPIPASNWWAQRGVRNGANQSWEVIQIKGEKGDKGDSVVGNTGNHGQGSFLYELSSGTDHTLRNKDNDVAAIAGRPAQDGDILSYVVGTTSSTHANDGRFDYLRKNGSWLAFVSIVDGDQIIHGTVAAEHIKAATITGDLISATTTITAGTVANRKAFMSGSGSWRFWAGGDVSSTAPFRVDQYGNLYATNGYFKGNITASGMDVSLAAIWAANTASIDQTVTDSSGTTSILISSFKVTPQTDGNNVTVRLNVESMQTAPIRFIRNFSGSTSLDKRVEMFIPPLTLKRPAGNTQVDTFSLYLDVISNTAQHFECHGRLVSAISGTTSVKIMSSFISGISYTSWDIALDAGVGTVRAFKEDNNIFSQTGIVLNSEATVTQDVVVGTRSATFTRPETVYDGKPEAYLISEGLMNTLGEYLDENGNVISEAEAFGYALNPRYLALVNNP